MTVIIDKELRKWIDTAGTLDDTKMKLKDGAPDNVKKKFEVWKKEWEEYEAQFEEDDL